MSDDTDHRQIELVHPTTGERIEVDEGIGDLILEMWRAGIETILSCQENRPGTIWVETTVEGARHFLNIVAQYDATFGSLYWRALQGFGEDDWEYDLLPIDVNKVEWVENDEVEHEHIGATYVNFFLSVRFPTSDLPLVLERLLDHNKGRRG